MGTINLKGGVSSGQGEAAKFLELPWVMKQIVNKLGFTPYPGTLNILLSKENKKRQRALEKATPIRLCPAEGYSGGKIFKAFLYNIECAIVIPEISGYPLNIVEIISPAYLRKQLQLQDGDEVTVAVTF